MHKKNNEINLIITDLDDTIWTWFSMWHASFSSLIRNISDFLNVKEDILESSFRKLHQKYHSTESSYILDELDCLLPNQIESIKDENNKLKNCRSILHEYYSLKKNNLHLHQGVDSFFQLAMNMNICIIGYTESNSFFTKQRLKHLNLDGKLHKIYAPKDYVLPISVRKVYPDNYWEPQHTEFEYLPEKDKKPNPETLLDIIKREGKNKEQTLYIGDKLSRDIIMANEAKILSAYAKYGDCVDKEQYTLLRKVSHWSDEDVLREQEIQKNVQSPQATPDFILQNGLDEIFDFIKI